MIDSDSLHLQTATLRLVLSNNVSTGRERNGLSLQAVTMDPLTRTTCPARMMPMVAVHARRDFRVHVDRVLDYHPASAILSGHRNYIRC